MTNFADLGHPGTDINRSKVDRAIKNYALSSGRFVPQLLQASAHPRIQSCGVLPPIYVVDFSQGLAK